MTEFKWERDAEKGYGEYGGLYIKADTTDDVQSVTSACTGVNTYKDQKLKGPYYFSS